jgi:hypothetical protein
VPSIGITMAVLSRISARRRTGTKDLAAAAIDAPWRQSPHRQPTHRIGGAVDRDVVAGVDRTYGTAVEHEMRARKGYKLPENASDRARVENRRS